MSVQSFRYGGREYRVGDDITFHAVADEKRMSFFGMTDDGIVILLPKAHHMTIRLWVEGARIVRVEGRVDYIKRTGERKGYVIVSPRRVEKIL